MLGGNGYVEESGLPRLYRQSPLNSIWEGSGNVIALDVLRAMGRSSDTLAAVTRRDRARARGRSAASTTPSSGCHAELGDPEQLPLRARRIAGLLALCLQGSLLLRHAPQAGRRRVLRLPPGRGLGRGPRHAAGGHGDARRSSNELGSRLSESSANELR